MKGFKFLSLDSRAKIALLSMIKRECYRPHDLIPINNECLYVVEKGLLRWLAVENDKEVTIAFVVENEIFGMPELVTEIPCKYSILYYCAEENSKILVLDKEKWNRYISAYSDLQMSWVAQVEKQRCALDQWLRQFRNKNKERLFVELMRNKPQFLKNNRLRHLYSMCDFIPD